MGWVRIEDSFFRHRKVVDLSVPAKALFLAGLCRASEQLTDGFLSIGAVRAMVGELGISTKTPAELVASGMWHKTDGGYDIHDYLDYQPSAESERRRRDQVSRRVQQHRARKRWSNASRNAVTSPVTDTVTPPVSNDAPEPIPELLTSSSSDENAGQGAGEPGEEEDEKPPKASPKVVAQALDLLANRHLAASLARGNTVHSRGGWLKADRTSTWNTHKRTIAALDLAAFTSPEALADHLEAAPPPKPPHPLEVTAAAQAKLRDEANAAWDAERELQAQPVDPAAVAGALNGARSVLQRTPRQSHAGPVTPMPSLPKEATR